MILTVTPNPAYDATYQVAELRPGEVHRVPTAHLRLGGKGVNVATVLAQLGDDVVATGFASQAFADELAETGLSTSFVTTLPHVRRTLAVVEPGRTTSFWEAGAPLPDGSAQQLLARVAELLDDARVLVVSGSLPPGAPDTLAADLAALSLAAGVPAVVDTSGAALRAAAEVAGVVLMPNADELQELAGPCHGAAEVVERGAALVAAGAGAVVATRGPEGLVAVDGSGSWLARPPRDVAGNPTGAGDAAAAAVARGLAGSHPLPEIAADAVALSAAAVAAPLAGTVDLALHGELGRSVRARRWAPDDRMEGSRR